MKRLATALAVMLVVLLFVGVGRLFALRFQSGDIFPAYSSHRADPLGTRVLYESLAACEGVVLERNYAPLLELLQTRRTPVDQTAILFLGDTVAETDAVPRNLYQPFKQFLEDGGRCVVVLRPRNIDPTERKRWNAKRAEKRQHLKDPDEPDTENESERDTCDDITCCPPGKKGPCRKLSAEPIRLSTWLGFGIDDIPAEASTQATREHGLTNSPLPDAISCHTSLVFTNLTPDWVTLYVRDAHPVMVEKRMGKGQFVLSAPSYFVSNEAMRTERHPGLLTWIVGNKTTVIVDEYHHGIKRNPTVSVLLRRRNLYWLALPLLAVVVLFIWQTNMRLPPPEPSGSQATTALTTDKDSSAALTNLLRSNLSPRSILDHCIQKWEQTSSLGLDDPRRIRARDICSSLPRAGQHKELIAAYNRVSTILKRKPLINANTDERTTS